MIVFRQILLVWTLLLCPFWAQSVELWRSIELIELQPEDFLIRPNLFESHMIRIEQDFSQRPKRIFVLEDFLGSGGEAKVVIAKSSGGKRVVLKILDHPSYTTNALPLLNKSPEASNLISMKYHISTDRKIIAVEMPVFEDFDYDVSTIIARHGKKSFRNYGYKLVLDIVSQLLTLQRNGLFHGDLKPENIVWDHSSREFKLIDIDHPSKIGKDSRIVTEKYYPRFGFDDDPSNLEYGLTMDLHALGMSLEKLSKAWQYSYSKVGIIELYHMGRVGRLGRMLQLMYLPRGPFGLNERKLWFDNFSARYEPRMSIDEYKRKLARFLKQPDSTSLVKLAKELVAWAQVQIDKNPCDEFLVPDVLSSAEAVSGGALK